MKTIKCTLVLIIAVTVTACMTHKKTQAPAATITSTYDVPSTPLVLMNPPSGFHAPGSEELTAIQEQYKDVTLTQLKAGYSLYSEGACIKCHSAQNIYRFTETQWKNIIDDMAPRAQLNDAEKDAVYKYVLSIKAAKPKDATCKQ